MADQKTTIGERVAGFRQQRGLTVEEVAAKSGIPAATVTAIEGSQVSPPLGQIIGLAEALEVTLGDLFGDSADAPFCIVRSGDRKTVSRFGSAEGRSGGYSYEHLGYKKQNRHMEPFLVTLNPTDGQPAEANQHLGEEILFVLEGEVEVRLGEHKDVLGVGDSIYYDSNLPHVVSCHGDAPATILAVIYARKEMLIL